MANDDRPRDAAHDYLFNEVRHLGGIRRADEFDEILAERRRQAELAAEAEARDKKKREHLNFWLAVISACVSAGLGLAQIGGSVLAWLKSLFGG